MSLREGRCPNCGSILQLDDAAEKGHCLFCDAVFENKKAFDIADDPSGHTFPNEPQPKYEGPSLDPSPERRGHGSVSKSAQKPRKKPKPPPPPVYVPKEPEKLPDIRVPRKVKLRIGLIALAVLLIIVGISAPVIIRRDQIRTELRAAAEDLAPFELDSETGVAIWHTANNYIIASASEVVTEEQARDFFMAYCEKRAELAGLNTDDFAEVYGSVSMKLVHPEGGYSIRKPESLSALEEGTGIKLLP